MLSVENLAFRPGRFEILGQRFQLHEDRLDISVPEKADHPPFEIFENVSLICLDFHQSNYDRSEMF